MKSIAYTLVALLALQVAVQAGADKAEAEKNEVKIESNEPITDVKVDVETPAEADKAKK